MSGTAPGAVETSLESGVFRITLSNPPLNVTSFAVRSGLSLALDGAEELARRGAVSRVVLTGAGRVFVAGADAREFDAAPVPPHLPDLCARIESFPVPVVAAINGAALGGGLELALACAARVAVPGAVLGLPETTLGLVPGAGGTQRLPRLTGLAVALALIPEGRSLTAAEALAAGLVDALTGPLAETPTRTPTDGPAKIEAKTAAETGAKTGADKAAANKTAANKTAAETAAKTGPETLAAPLAAPSAAPLAQGGDVVAAAAALGLPARPATGALPAPAPDPAAFAAARKAVARKLPRQTAPQQAIDLIEAACTLPLAGGLAQERATFLALRGSDQAAALRHVFFAERAAMAQGRKDPGAADIARAVVVGGGTMGAGIAHALAAAGIAVTLVEADAAAARRAADNVARLRDEAAARGRLTPAAAAAMAARTDFRAGYADLPAADIAIEAVFEDLAVKRAVFAALDAVLPETAILATNTSYLDPDRIMEGLRQPGRTLGLHFFSPAHVMKLVEVIRGRHTSEATLATALRLAGRLGKIPVAAGICDGFIGNRILTRYRQACDVMLIEGALPAQVDAAMRGFGMAMGPYEVQDLSGLDIAYANRKRLGWKTKPGFRYIPIADRIVEETGRLGRKTGAGWYDYPEAATAAAAIPAPMAAPLPAPATPPATATPVPTPATPRGPVPSALIEALVAEESARAGLTRRPFTDAEIVGRATAAMVEESAAILAEGIARTPEDIDLVLVHGYGFPRWRGGPMHWAQRQGLETFRSRIETLHAQDPRSWNPDPLKTLIKITSREP